MCPSPSWTRRSLFSRYIPLPSVLEDVVYGAPREGDAEGAA